MTVMIMQFLFLLWPFHTRSNVVLLEFYKASYPQLVRKNIRFRYCMVVIMGNFRRPPDLMRLSEKNSAGTSVLEFLKFRCICAGRSRGLFVLSGSVDFDKKICIFEVVMWPCRVWCFTSFSRVLFNIEDNPFKYSHRCRVWCLWKFHSDRPCSS